ncbi:MAG: DUF4339 domain-containing protein [Planctomycetaceae bacterium]|jgi:hypothetical protein|nr:DUF4339 domain-containing protein [Planctomycetaceae bacterium]
MGIRFFCPNGHKLNVKSSLAGLKGFCPECGIELVIPLTSTRKSSKEGGGLIENSQDNDSQPDLISMFSQSVNNIVTSQNLDLQNPLINWYIYDPNNGGDRQGPFRSQAIQILIKQNQIKPTFYIWHEGLPDWEQASSIFPELSNQK